MAKHRRAQPYGNRKDETPSIQENEIATNQAQPKGWVFFYVRNRAMFHRNTILKKVGQRKQRNPKEKDVRSTYKKKRKEICETNG